MNIPDRSLTTPESSRLPSIGTSLLAVGGAAALLAVGLEIHSWITDEGYDPTQPAPVGAEPAQQSDSGFPIDLNPLD